MSSRLTHALVAASAALALATLTVIGSGPAEAAPTTTPPAAPTAAPTTKAAANPAPTAKAAAPVNAAPAKAAPAKAVPAKATIKPVAATTTASAVAVTLDSMTPRSPDASKAAQVVTFTVSVTNNTNTTYSDLEFSLQRGLPIDQQHLLDAAIATPPETDYRVPSPLDLHKQLLPQGHLTLTYKTTASDMCLCFGGVYPYALVVRGISDANAGFAEVGRTQVFVPSFLETPKPVDVGWVWPLLDVPHRILDQNVFSDESLAGEIRPGGRLDRALQVPELVAGTVRLTLVVDPDLLDSLAVMASPAGYRVHSGTGSATVPGTGGKLAAAWLARLKAVRSDHDVVLTAYADPDVNAVTRAGLKWTTALDSQVQSRLSSTLNGDFSSDLLTWPVGGALTGSALDALVGGGASTILLSDASLSGGNKSDPKPDAISPLPSAAGSAVALVTDTPIQQTVSRALRLGATPANDQQTLLAQLAIRAEVEPSASHFVVITPDRYVDTNPQAAAATIESVVGTTWARTVALRTALDTVKPVDRGALQTQVENPATEVSPAQLAKLSTVQQQVASMNEGLHDNDAAAALLGGFSNGIQRAQSSAWRTNPAGQAAVVAALAGRIDSLSSDVHLVTPVVGTYSLSSADSPVVVTISNQLPKAFTVEVSVAAAIGVIGFKSPQLPPQTIAAQSIATVRIPTHVERLGKFQVIATLRTPDGRQLGQPLHLNLRATAIGSVTKIITVVAISVLVLALLRRFVLRLRNRGRKAVDAQ